MVRSFAVLLAVPLVAAAVIAGCLGGGPGGKGAGGTAQDNVPALQATATTGVIRAVVVDEAIRPLANATVTVSQGGTSAGQTRVTDAGGFAGFQDLQPGTYFLKVTKSRYLDAQQSVDVVAGVAEPPVAKVQLVLRTGDIPFYSEFKIDAFMECSAAIGNWCFIANYYPCFVEKTAGQACTGNLTNDNSFFNIPLETLQRIPDWLQAEMVWESTQSVSSYMNMRLDVEQTATFLIDNSSQDTGASPLLVVYPVPYFQKWGLGINHTLSLEAFHGGIPTLCDAQPDTCFVGLALEQRFTYIVHVFYGYTPPEGWRFSTDGKVPPPP